MRSLLVRIFASFWLIIVLTIAAAGVIGYSYAERLRATVENFEVSEAMLDASEALDSSGREGLENWLRSLPKVTGSLIFVLDERGNDLLDRRVPAPVKIALRRFGGRDFRPPPPRFDNLVPARPFTQLLGPDDQVYTFFVLPPRKNEGRWLIQPAPATLVVLALLSSAAVSYLLARALSRPIRRLRDSTVEIAAGNLDTRVSDAVGKRHDEIGLLAKDFDRMAARLERAWQQQTELTRNVSHELRSPLARLRVATELARRKAGEIAEFDRIDEETYRLNELIGQLLKLSRLDGPEKDRPVSIDLGELLAGVADDVRYEFADADGAARLVLDATENIVIQGYPEALRGAVENIVRNAMQHGGDGGDVSIQLGIEGSSAVIAVLDQGGGVAEAELEHLFEPFFRGRAPAERNEGSGLGLAIAARAAALHDGRITAANENGGLRVELSLPLPG